MTPPLAVTTGIAFQGNAMWLTTLDGTGQILKYGPGKVENSNTKPNKTFIVNSLSEPLGCLFDSAGDLWVVDADPTGQGEVHELSAAQLAGPSGTITPAVTISSSSLVQPAFATFNAGGALWVSSEGNNQIVKFGIGQLASGGTSVIPKVIISSPSLSGPGQLAFDPLNGSLWVTNATNGTIVKFGRGQLKATGSPTARVVITLPTNLPGQTLTPTPWGLTFDAQGRMWVYDYTAGDLLMYGPGKLKTSGTPTPTRILSGLPLYAAQLTFGPAF